MIKQEQEERGGRSKWGVERNGGSRCGELDNSRWIRVNGSWISGEADGRLQ